MYTSTHTHSYIYIRHLIEPLTYVCTFCTVPIHFQTCMCTVCTHTWSTGYYLPVYNLQIQHTHCLMMYVISTLTRSTHSAHIRIPFVCFFCRHHIVEHSDFVHGLAQDPLSGAMVTCSWDGRVLTHHVGVGEEYGGTKMD